VRHRLPSLLDVPPLLALIAHLLLLFLLEGFDLASKVFPFGTGRRHKDQKFLEFSEYTEAWLEKKFFY